MKIKTAEQILDDLKIVRYREVFLKAMQLHSDQQNKELEEKLMSEQIENGYLQAFRVSNEAEITRLREGVEELKNDLLDALDLKNGNGPTALTMLSNEITRLRELVTQYLDNSTSDNAYGADVRDRILNELNPKP